MFLAVSFVASRLSHVARARAEEAVGRRDELARLFELSRDVLVMTASPAAVSHLARAIGRRFDLEYIAITLPEGEGWSVSAARDGAVHLGEQHLTDAFDAAARSLEFDAYERTYAGHRSIQTNGQTVRLAAASWDNADRPARGSRATGGARHARYVGWSRGHRNCANALSRRAEERRTDAAK